MNGTTPVNFDRRHVGVALQNARQSCANELRWLNAVNRAGLNLEACRWQFDGTMLRIESAHESNKYYITTRATCECSAHKAGRPCWHRAAVALLQRAVGIAARGALTVPTLADLQADVGALYN